MKDPKQAENYILTVRKNNQYAAEAYSLNLCGIHQWSITDDVIIGCACIQEAISNKQQTVTFSISNISAKMWLLVIPFLQILQVILFVH